MERQMGPVQQRCDLCLCIWQLRMFRFAGSEADIAYIVLAMCLVEQCMGPDLRKAVLL